MIDIRDLFILGGTLLVQVVCVHAFRRASWRGRSYLTSALWSCAAAGSCAATLWLIGVPASVFLVCIIQLVLTLGMLLGFFRFLWLRRGRTLLQPTGKTL